MNKIINIVKTELWNNILKYCCCWSGKKYSDCCFKQLNNFFEIKIQDKYDYESHNLLWELVPDLVDALWKDIVWKSSNGETLCVFKNCNESSIDSHLFWNKYLQKNIDKNIDIIKPLSIKDIKEIQSPISLKTKLFCQSHDGYYNITDQIQNFWEVINDNVKIENFILKTMFFRFKATAINMRLLILDMKKTKDFELWQGIEFLLELYKENYKMYNFLCWKIDEYNNKKILQFRILCKSILERDLNEKNVFYSNIVYKNSYPFYIALVQDNSWINIILACFENIPDDILNFIKSNLEEYSKLWKEYFIKFIESYFELNSPKNRIWYIHWNDLVDIWIKV